MRSLLTLLILLTGITGTASLVLAATDMSTLRMMTFMICPVNPPWLEPPLCAWPS